METNSQSESEEDASQKRIQMYRSILNYYRSRSLSLDHILSSKQANDTIPPEIKTEEGLDRAVKGLYDDITLMQSFKQYLDLVKQSLSKTAVEHRQDIIDKVEGIIYFSRSLIQLYNSCPTELEIIEKMKTYSGVLAEYERSLEAFRESQKDEDKQVTEKAELQVYKINLIRMLKAVLIGFISTNCPGMVKYVEQFQTTMRRNLAVDDFTDSWDVGLLPP